MDEGLIFKKLLSPLLWSLLCHVSANNIDTWTLHDLSTDPKFVLKGGQFTLQCRVPRTGFHLWFKDGKTISTSAANGYHLYQDPQLYIYNGSEHYVTLKLSVNNADTIHTGEYKCSLSSPYYIKVVVVTENIIETNEDEPGLKLLVIGKDLVLQCNTTQCPQCQVVWYKDGKLLDGKFVDDDDGDEEDEEEDEEEEEDEDNDEDHIIINKKTNSVTIQQASYNDSGVYVCAIDRTKLDVALNASIEVQTEIKLEKFESASDVVVEGHPLILYCLAKAAPNPSIKWFKGETEISSSDKRIQLLEHNGLKNAKLYIEEADYEDRANYSCEAYNRVHSAKIAIFIRIKDRLAALWPFLGICVEVAILCSVIFVYEKRKSAESNEADTDLPGDNSNIRDQNQRGQAVRQRK